MEKIKITYIKEIYNHEIAILITDQDEIILISLRDRIIHFKKKLKCNKIIKIEFCGKLNIISIISNSYNIPILRLEEKYTQYELSFVGNLVGHLNFIKSSCMSYKIQALITIDESAVIKVWDL